MPMSQDEIYNVLRTLGNIDARMVVIEQRMFEDRASADNHRSGLLAAITAMSQSTLTLNAKVEGLNDEIKEMKPLVESWRKTRDQADGAAKVATFLKAIAIAAITGIASLIAWMVAHINQVHK